MDIGLWFHAPKHSKVTGKVDKCNLCADRLDKGGQPSCIEACLTGALTLLDPEQPDPLSSVKWIPGFGETRITKPATRFIFSNSLLNSNRGKVSLWLTE